jgi:hypothetical protein
VSNMTDTLAVLRVLDFHTRLIRQCVGGCGATVRKHVPIEIDGNEVKRRRVSP